ncbi:MAG: response regulator [Ardenticatenaceae bacterium]|nr:response regulator [Ardenticatenaceae bacterium]
MILIVDDESLILLALQARLEELGYEVLVATSGDEAYSLYNQHKTEIKYVITDWVMPRMGGDTLVTTLRADNPALRIIVTSGYPIGLQNPDDPIHEANFFLQKPFRTQDLVNAIQQLSY